MRKKANGKRRGGPNEYQKGEYNIYVRESFSMVVMCVKLLTKLMLILGLGRCSLCQICLCLYYLPSYLFFSF